MVLSSLTLSGHRRSIQFPSVKKVHFSIIYRAVNRVENITIFEILAFVITFRILRAPMEHVKIKSSLDSKLQTFFIQGCAANPDDENRQKNRPN